MKNLLEAAGSAAFMVLIAGALWLPAVAQEGNGAEQAPGHAQAGAEKSLVAAQKKTAVKKKAVKKKKAKAVESPSEYRFQAQDTPLAYTFDKKGDPIVKKQSGTAKSLKKGGKSAAGGKQAAGQPLPKLNGKGGAAGNTASYVCPMGEFEDIKPGICPKCGMTLIVKK